MAGHLARAGHRVTVYNRTPARAEAFLQAHAGLAVRSAATPAEAARGADFVFACTGADPDLEAITLGPDGAFAAMRAGALFVDHTTASAELAQRLHREARGRGLAFLDAPVSGGQSGAEQGTLTIMVGGLEADHRRVAPLLDCYARKHARIGPAGHGQWAKMVNQICIAGLVEALAEGLHFGERVGLDVAAVVDVISHGAAASWQMQNRAGTMLEDRFDFGFAVDWMRKDLGMALAEAHARGIPLPATELVDGRYAEVQRLGGGRLDSSSLMRVLREESRRGGCAPGGSGLDSADRRKK
ncbi:MAG: NAD(P)-dependent oxidoreductase [Myxococcales bacterium]|nr:NAD(P)-dependent oxidoreductase [Myxococcales bacterium]